MLDLVFYIYEVKLKTSSAYFGALLFSYHEL